MIKHNNDRLPKWVSVGILIAAIAAVVGIGYMRNHSRETAIVQPIGHNITTEKIDQNWNNGE